MQIGLMIEGQIGLNWERWSRILSAAEDLGFQCVFRSDHFVNPTPPDMDSLELWVSLTYAAAQTKRIEFGSLVAPTTFRHPSMTVRMAAAVDDLSSGRLIFGLGAGWNEREHKAFGVPFYDKPTRFAMLTDALEITSRLLRSSDHVSYQGQHFSLDQAILLPRPKRPTPILIGGNGMNKTLPLAAKYADEWNGVYINPAAYKERTTRLDQLLTEQGRNPADVKRSLMHGSVLADDEGELRRILQEENNTTPDAARERGMLVGSPADWVDQLGKFAEAGVQRIMIQWLDLDDLAGIERVATQVLPHFKPVS